MANKIIRNDERMNLTCFTYQFYLAAFAMLATKCRTLGKQYGIKCETPLRTSNENIGQNNIWCRFKEKLWGIHRELIEPIRKQRFVKNRMGTPLKIVGNM
jgi:hypothetical protein